MHTFSQTLVALLSLQVLLFSLVWAAPAPSIASETSWEILDEEFDDPDSSTTLYSRADTASFESADLSLYDRDSDDDSIENAAELEPRTKPDDKIPPKAPIYSTWKVWQAWHEYYKRRNQNPPERRVPRGVPRGSLKSSMFKKNKPPLWEWTDGCGNKQTMVLGKTLGTGHFGTVYEGTLSDGSKVAAKQVSTNAGDMISGAQVEQVIRSNNVVQVVDYFQRKDGKGAFLLMPMVRGGDLFDKVKKWDAATRDNAFKQILNGVKAIHNPEAFPAANAIHRDLKLENVMIDGNTMKIADFDQAELTAVDGKLDRFNVGTPGYVAPEILYGKPYGKEVDIFSLGVMLMEMWEPWSSQDKRYKIWMALGAKRDDDHVGVDRTEVKNILKKIGKFTNIDGEVLNDDQLDLLSRVLCGPDRRIDIDEFISRFAAISRG
ncbi:kinase-like domain-containing protein [Penicillium alfredii]|uniref:Kinase-like domain-containing protein n=1 Tax=Penicillium alfredii TaxID=1506179 RepID=A0A9W9FSZ5_9EURO|nr:kinase-like domain-containing protein [Penicillium alfredii]KAJ5105784.1 kinase-like domain-containing protein [Penicillium alfredii]